MSLIERAFAVDWTIPEIVPSEKITNPTLGGLVSQIGAALSYIIGLIAFIYLIYAGILYITANGNDEQAKKGQKGIINAVIGIIIIVLALTIIGVAQNLGAGKTQ